MAVSECVPAPSVPRVTRARPRESSVRVKVPPPGPLIWKVTVPAGVPAGGKKERTVAVKVTGWP